MYYLIPCLHLPQHERCRLHLHHCQH
jgi:hypothetical protein